MEASDLLGRCRFPPPGSELTCAVSGGADSLALLALAVEAGCRVTAVHVDHQLRPGSAAEAEAVAEAARRLGAGFRSVSVRVAPGPNLQARARQARWSVLPADAATGHTADDQAETVLINLMRGAGSPGLAGMRPGPRHPILALRRAETRQLCAERGLPAVEDPTNSDRRFLRSRVRHELVPLLSQLAGRDVVPVLARQAELLREESDLLDALAAALDPADARRLSAAPPALARRALRSWIRALGPHPPPAASVERALEVARGRARAAELGGGSRVRRSAGRLFLEPPPAARRG